MEFPDIDSHVRALITKISFAVNVLRNWHALHYTGHFIDAHPEMKERIDEVHQQTIDALKQWDIKSFPEQHAVSGDAAQPIPPCSDASS